jgi:hypothetical protein
MILFANGGKFEQKVVEAETALLAAENAGVERATIRCLTDEQGERFFPNGQRESRQALCAAQYSPAIKSQEMGRRNKSIEVFHCRKKLGTDKLCDFKDKELDCPISEQPRTNG